MPKTRTLWKLHSVTTVWASGYLLFLFLTGILALFADPLLRWETRESYQVPSDTWQWSELGPATESAMRSAADDNPNLILTGLTLPSKAGQALRYNFQDPNRRPKGTGADDPFYLRAYHVDPGSAQVTGSFDLTRSIDGFVRALHVRFFAGTFGRNLTGLFGIVLCIATISGLCILTRFLNGRSLFHWKRKNLRQFASDAHKSIACFSVPFLALFALTGTWLGLQGRIMQGLEIERPERSFNPPKHISPAEDASLTVDWKSAAESAQRHFPDLRIEAVQLSTNGTRLLTFTGSIAGLLAERQIPRIVLDKTTLEPVFQLDPRKLDFGSWLFLVQEPLHFGDFAGWLSLWIWALAGVALSLLSIAGLLIYLRRSKISWRIPAFWTGTALGFILICWLLYRKLGLYASLDRATPFLFGIVFLSLLAPYLKQSSTGTTRHLKKHLP